MLFFPKIPNIYIQTWTKWFSTLTSLHLLPLVSTFSSLRSESPMSFIWVSPANQVFFLCSHNCGGGWCSFQPVTDPAVGQVHLFPSSDPPMPTFRQPQNQICCSAIASTDSEAGRWHHLQHTILHSQNQAQSNMLSVNWLWELPFGKEAPCPQIVL